MSAAAAGAGKRVAIMQPYFFPYAGYFRLLTEVDEFVLLDCVQFPRRGRVHRCETSRTGDGPTWLTLPLAHQSRVVRIRDLAFAGDARAAFDQRLRAQPGFASARGVAADAVRSLLRGPLEGVVDLIEASLRLVLQLAGRQAVIVRSSSLAIDDALRGQDRILAIAGARAATSYLNAPGGRALYRPAAFDSAGIALQFLSPYRGEFPLLLPALMSPRGDAVLAEIAAGHAGEIELATTLPRG